MNYNFSSNFTALKPSAIREMLKRTSEPGMIPFAAGNPAPEAFPTELVEKASAKILSLDPISVLQYSVTEGYVPLRNTIKTWIKKDYNIGTDSDDILIVSGAQQGIDLTCRIFCNKGDSIICENPSFIGSLNSFRSYGVNLVGVDVESDGISIEGLEKAIKESTNIKLIYVIPNFQNPTGITMSLEKRKAVYDLALKNNLIIIEDNPYGDLRYNGEEIPSIKSMDTEGIVVYCGSFSKIVAPALRVGFVCANKDIIPKLVVGKQCADVHSSTYSQYICNEILNSTEFPNHLKKLKEIYRRKCSLMLDTMDSCINPKITYTRPQGGLFLWATLPQNVNMLDFCNICVDHKAAVVPGTTFLTDGNIPSSCFRLNFSTPTDEQIITGVEILGKISKKI